MTKRATATEAQVRRTAKGLLAAGLRVTGVTHKPDGSVTVETAPLAAPPDQDGIEQTPDVVL